MSTMTTRPMVKRIAISDENYKKLQKLGDAGDSFNDVITRLVEGAVRKRD